MVTLTSVGTHLVCSLLLMRVLSFRGLALSASISFTAAALVGYALLRKEMSAEEPLFPLSWLARIGTGLCWLFAGVGGYGVLFPYPVTESFAHRGFWFGGVFILGVLLYAFSTRYVGTHEWQWIRQAVTRKGERHDRTE
jgi:putative peptidoglycan lipid II flippase